MICFSDGMARDGFNFFYGLKHSWKFAITYVGKSVLCVFLNKSPSNFLSSSEISVNDTDLRNYIEVIIPMKLKNTSINSVPTTHFYFHALFLISLN